MKEEVKVEQEGLRNFLKKATATIKKKKEKEKKKYRKKKEMRKGAKREQKINRRRWRREEGGGNVRPISGGVRHTYSSCRVIIIKITSW